MNSALKANLYLDLARALQYVVKTINGWTDELVRKAQEELSKCERQ